MSTTGWSAPLRYDAPEHLLAPELRFKRTHLLIDRLQVRFHEGELGVDVRLLGLAVIIDLDALELLLFLALLGGNKQRVEVCQRWRRVGIELSKDPSEAEVSSQWENRQLQWRRRFRSR